MLWAKHKTKKVFLGLSGGVDSAVSAALLRSQGYDVIGIFIRIALPGYPCSAGVDKIEAMRVAAHLRIPFREIDLSSAYVQEVFGVSLEEFERGHTPNPDVLCNREIKFGAFYTYARREGADYIATGHYATTKGGFLYLSADTEKDQTYFLSMVSQDALMHTLFPVGGMTKSKVRSLAQKFKLPNARRHDSQGLCFLGDITLGDMLTRELAPTTGQVLLESGEIVGTHDGVAYYTLGQRHGFTLATQTPDTVPHFVIKKDIEANTLTVATSPYPTGATKTVVHLTNSNWIGTVTPGPCMARYRYRQKLLSAELDIQQGLTTVTLTTPCYVPLGQTLVVYRGSRCLGGGSISHSILM